MLAWLRGLRYHSVQEWSAGAPVAAHVVVEIAGLERWSVSPDQVAYRSLDRGTVAYAAITPAQYVYGA